MPMRYSVDTSKLFELVARALEVEFTALVDATDGVGTENEIELAHEQVCQLRDEVHRYDSNHRAEEFKPCINPRIIADRIAREFRERYRVAYVHRVCAYKTIFIMYLICRLIPPIRRSWWEKRFLEIVPTYLEQTDFFKGINCKHRLDVILDKLPQDGVLPMEVERLAPDPRPNYPLLYPVQVFQGCLFVDLSRNEKCQQFFGPVRNSLFQKSF